MKLIPAIDLMEGKCVRLSKGKEKSSVVYNNNPVDQAKFFQEQGCQRIHIVDLDAAFGNAISNKATILDIRKAISIDIELGGGIRSEKDVIYWLENGINYLILGSLVINQPEKFKQISNKFPNKIFASLDDRLGEIMIEGWIKNSNFKTENIISDYNNSNIKGYIFTDVSRDGMLTGINITKVKNLLNISKKPLIISGGLSNEDDLKNLAKLNDPLLEGVVVGKSFYLNKINIKRAQKAIDSCLK